MCAPSTAPSLSPAFRHQCSDNYPLCSRTCKCKLAYQLLLPASRTLQGVPSLPPSCYPESASESLQFVCDCLQSTLPCLRCTLELASFHSVSALSRALVTRRRSTVLSNALTLQPHTCFLAHEHCLGLCCIVLLHCCRQPFGHSCRMWTRIGNGCE